MAGPGGRPPRNLLLLSYFADKGELSASVVQGVGVCATGALLTQITLAGHIPVGPFVVAAAAVLVGLVVSLARMLGRVGPVDANGVPCVGNVQCHLSFAGDAQGALQTRLQVVSNGLWGFYQGALAVIGLAALPQVGLKSLLPAETAARMGLAPGATGAALGVVLVVLGRAGKLPPALATAWGRLSGWTATLLFMTMPVAQLAANFASPATLEGLSVLSSLLAMLGNALMVPRALYTRDVIWLTGSTWGCTLMGWGVMLSLFLGRHADGTRYVGARVLLGAHRGVLRLPRRRVDRGWGERARGGIPRGVETQGVELPGDERGAAPGGYQKRGVRVTRSQSDASSNV